MEKKKKTLAPGPVFRYNEIGKIFTGWDKEKRKGGIAMKNRAWRRHLLCFAAALLALSCSLTACSAPGLETDAALPVSTSEPTLSSFVSAVEDEPDTVDFQCTTIHYTVATNVFDRLVEMENDEEGNVKIVPSLAKAWEVSGDGCGYTFHLRENVKFSNGSPLTASDVLYTFTRLLTHPDSCNRDIADPILGAEELEKGESDRLEGFKLLSDLDFTITLRQPFEAFLACLSMPGASILDEETTVEAGDRFGLDPACTIGTGPFILWQWEPGEGMKLRANPGCWSGAPRCEGVNLLFMTEPEDIRAAFEKGEMDILDLDEVGNAAEFYFHGDIYQDRLYAVQRIGITYIALNASVEPLNDARVRKALQLSLNRTMLLDAVYSGRGVLENGIFPHGLYGYNPELPDIPCDPDAAKALLSEAGYENGFDLKVSVKSSSTQWEMILMEMAVEMWKKIGVRAEIDLVDEAEFMRLRKSGQLSCYTALWTADFNDPDNFIYTFFGDRENARFRSLCYPNEEIMERVRRARAISDPERRVAEYRELEKIIVQDDAAWIPLFSRLHYYVTAERLEGFRTSWNGSVKNNFRYFSVK